MNKVERKISRTTLYSITFCFFLLLINVILGVILTRQSSNSMRELIRSRMLDISNTAASMLDGDALEQISAEDADTEEYKQILKTLTYYQDHIDLKYIYCIRDLGHKEFVFSVDPTVEDPGEFGEPIVYTDALYTASLGTPAVDSEPYVDRWGRFYSAYSPVFDSKGKVGGIVAVDFAADWYDEQISRQIRTTLLISLMTLLFGTAIVLLIATQFRKRFLRLYDELNSLSDGIETMAKELADESVLADTTKLLHEEETDDDVAYDEISTLSNKVRTLQKGLGRQISFVRIKAYRDGLTGLENRNAYWEYVNEIDEQIKNGEASFAVAMFDVNGLKRINDAEGHENGDRIILKAADILKTTFAGEHIFRIGGDEFVVIMNTDENGMQERIDSFDKLVDEVPPVSGEINLSVSKGYAVYHKEKDWDYQNVFVRADRQMYAQKRAHYETVGDRRQNRE